MAGVGLTGKIVPLNGGNFPVFEDINGQGGMRVVPSIAARDGLLSSPGFLKAGMQVLVAALQCIYTLEPDLATWAFFSSLPSLAKQTTWFVHGGGNDTNDGATASSPLRTVEELSERLCPGGRLLRMQNHITVSLAGGAYRVLALNVDFAEFTLKIAGTMNASAPINLATVVATNPATNTRGQLTTAAGAFTAKERIRCIDGAQNGSVAYCTGLTSPTNAFVGGWFNFLSLSTGAPAPGTNALVETYSTSLNTLVLRTQGGVTGGSAGWVELADVGLQNVLYANYSPYEYLFLNGCQLEAGFFAKIWGGLQVQNCKILGGTFWEGGTVVFQGCAFQGAQQLTGTTNLRLSFSNTLDGGSFQFQTNNSSGHCSLRVTQPVEHQNGAGLTAYSLNPACRLVCNALMWGATAAPYALKGNLASGSWIYSTAIANWAFASVADWTISGHAIANAGTPIGYPRADCGIAISPDPAALGVAT